MINTKINKRTCKTCKKSFNNKKNNEICDELCRTPDYKNWEPAPKRCVFCVHYPEDEPFHARWEEGALPIKSCKDNYELENRENDNIDWAIKCKSFEWKHPELMEPKGEFKLAYDPTDISKWDMNKEGSFWGLEKDYKPLGIAEYKETRKVQICLECTKYKKEGCPFYKKKSQPREFKKHKKVIPKQILTCSAFESSAKQDFLDSYDSMINALKKEEYIWSKIIINKKDINSWKDKYNKIEIKGGVKDMEGLEEHKKEVEKIRKLINEIEEKRQKRFDKSCFKEAFEYKYYSKMYSPDERKWKIKKDFYNFLKDFPDIYIEDLSISLKQLKKYKLTTSTSGFLSKKEFSNEEWKEFENILYIIDKYYPKFELHQEQKKLCFLTDCYKKLATEKTCDECGSVNPIEAKFCNQCGNGL